MSTRPQRLPSPFRSGTCRPRLNEIPLSVYRFIPFTYTGVFGFNTIVFLFRFFIIDSANRFFSSAFSKNFNLLHLFDRRTNRVVPTFDSKVDGHRGPRALKLQNSGLLLTCNLRIAWTSFLVS
jgi:hypothetical protein